MLFIDEIPLKKSASITSTYELKTSRKAWPAGSYKVEIRLESTLNQTSRDELGRKKLTGNVSTKKLNVKAGVSKLKEDGRLVLTLPYTVN